MKYAARKVESVLWYFERYERLARLRNDRPSYQHFERCWQLVAGRFYGQPAVLSRQFLGSPPELPVPPVKHKPAMPPLRKVVARRVQGEGIEYLLLCGHILPDWLATMDDPLPRHKRCKECEALPAKSAKSAAA